MCVCVCVCVCVLLFRETVAVYYENHTEHIYTLCEHYRSYLTGNTLHLRYKANRLMMFRETVAVYCGVGVLLTADSQSTSISGYRASLWDP
jgi:hypothetical protein